MSNNFKGKEFNETRDEGTSSRTSADHVRLRASEADHGRSDQAYQITEWTEKIETLVNKDIPYDSNCRSELRNQHDTISRQSNAMLQSETYGLFLSAHDRMYLRDQQNSTHWYHNDYMNCVSEIEHYKEEYSRLKTEYTANPDACSEYIEALTELDEHLNQANRTLFEVTRHLDTDLGRHKKLLEEVCSNIKNQLSHEYGVGLSEAAILEGLEEHLYQGVDKMLERIYTNIRSKKCKKMLCVLIDESHKATGESNKEVAHKMIAEKLLAKLDKKELPQRARKSLLKPLCILGGRNKEMAGMVADKLVRMFHNESHNEEDLCKCIPKALGMLVEEDKELAKSLVNPLFEALHNKEFHIRVRKYIPQAFEMMVNKTQDKAMKEDIKTRLKIASKDENITSQVHRAVDTVLDKWSESNN